MGIGKFGDRFYGELQFHVATPKTGTFFFKNRKNLSFSQISQTKSGGGEGAWMTSWCLCTVPTYNEVRCQPSDTLPAAISSALYQAEENLGFQAGTLEVSSVSSSSRSSSGSANAPSAAVGAGCWPPGGHPAVRGVGQRERRRRG